MFLYTTDGKQSSLVCCHNDSLAYNISRLPNYLKHLCNCECYVPCFDSSCLFTYFLFFQSHYNSSVDSVKSRLHTKCEITVSICILEGINTRASGIRGYFPQPQIYQDFLSINSMLKELYCTWKPLGCIEM